MFRKTQKKAEFKLENANFNNFKLEKKEFHVVPLGSSICFANLSNKNAKEFLKRKLEVYTNIKKRFIKLLLRLRLFPKKELNSPKGIDILMFGNRIKLFDFNKREIQTIKENSKEVIKRGPFKKYLNMPKILLSKKNLFKERLISPCEDVDQKDILDAFKNLIVGYKRYQKITTIKKLISSKEERGFKYIKLNNFSPKKQKTKILCSKVHGDFWKGNLLKANSNILFIDFDNSGDGLVVEDLFRYFLTSKIYANSFNKRLMSQMCLLLMKSLNLEKKELISQIKLESYITALNKDKKIKKNIIKTKNIFLKVINSS